MTATSMIEQMKVKEVQLQQGIGKKKACIEDRERDYQYEEYVLFLSFFVYLFFFMKRKTKQN